MNQKEEEANDSIAHTNAQISLAKADNEELKTGINIYNQKSEQLESTSQRIQDVKKTRNAIPNLLNQIMSVIPASVQITSIQNTQDRHVVINAQSDKYEQIGYFVAVLKNDVILTEVTSTPGQKSNGVVTIQIEGELPI